MWKKGHYTNKFPNGKNNNSDKKVTVESAHLAKEEDEQCKLCFGPMPQNEGAKKFEPLVEGTTKFLKRLTRFCDVSVCPKVVNVRSFFNKLLSPNIAEEE